MSVRSIKWGRQDSNVIKRKCSNSQQISSLNTVTLYSTCNKSTHALIQRLLKLEVDLVSRINELKQDKISALEQYNHEYDRYCLLTLSLNHVNSQGQKQKTQQETINQQYNIDEEFNNDNNTTEERELRKLLTQLYSTRDSNNLLEASLSLEQLEQLNYLLKSKNSSQKPSTISTLLFTTKDSNLFKQSIQKNTYNSASSQARSIEEISILREVIQKLLSKKLSYLKCHQQLVSSTQSQSMARVNELLSKRIFLQRQLESINKLLLNLETQYIQTNTKNHPNSLQKESSTFKKWKHILKYKQINQNIFQLQELSNSLNHNKKDIQSTNTNTYQNYHFNQHISQQGPYFDSSRVTSGSKLKLLNELKEKTQKEPLNQQYNSVYLKQTQQLEILQQKIQNYENYIKEQNTNKHQLYKEIQTKKHQLDQLKTQNQLMLQILQTANL